MSECRWHKCAVCLLLSHNAVIRHDGIYPLRIGKLFWSCICPGSLLSVYQMTPCFYSCKHFILVSSWNSLDSQINRFYIYIYIYIYINADDIRYIRQEKIIFTIISKFKMRKVLSDIPRIDFYTTDVLSIKNERRNVKIRKLFTHVR